MIGRKRCDLWKCSFYLRNSNDFNVTGSISGAKMREKEAGISIRIQNLFFDEFGTILGDIWGAKIVQTPIKILSFFLEGSSGRA